MKKNTCYILTLAITLLSIFNGCKNKDIDCDTFKIETEKVTPAIISVSISGSYSFSGIVKGMKVSIGENENLNDASSYDLKTEGTDFSVTVGNLKPSTTHYYRYSIDFGSNDAYLTDIKTFTTQNALPEKPTVKALDVLAIDDSTYRVKCEVVSDGGREVKVRGICWNNYGDPSLDDDTIAHSTGGVGEYTIRMENLDLGKKYYIRAYARNAVGVSLSEEVLEFETEAPVGMPVEIILGSNPQEGGTVSGAGFYEVGSQCSVSAEANEGYNFVNWTENGEPVSEEETYTFTVTVSRSLTANFRKQTFHINASVAPDNSGTVTGGGDYEIGASCELVATPKTGYDFVAWKKEGIVVSTNASYSFTVTESANYVAHFQLKSFTITLESGLGGSVTGGGSYHYGDNCTVTATPITGYAFDNWMEGNNVVSVNAEYSFQVTRNRDLKASFTKLQLAPEGAIDGIFTISDSKDQVYFSQGNLQYIGSAETPYWKFAEHQWDYLGGQNNSMQNTNRDLFGWGTSGFHNSSDSYNVNYEPWATSLNEVNATYNKYGYGPSTNMLSQNLTGSSRKYDWGINNEISNGGNTANIWRVLTSDEWNYVFKQRQASTVNNVHNARFAKAKVNNICGVILFPDDYTHPSGVEQPKAINVTGSSGWSTNNYSADDFLLMEVEGAVFLPATGYRDGVLTNGVGSIGNYWSSTYTSSSLSSGLYFNSLSLSNNDSERYKGYSVRLVIKKQ